MRLLHGAIEDEYEYEVDPDPIEDEYEYPDPHYTDYGLVFRSLEMQNLTDFGEEKPIDDNTELEHITVGKLKQYLDAVQVEVEDRLHKKFDEFKGISLRECSGQCGYCQWCVEEGLHEELNIGHTYMTKVQVKEGGKTGYIHVRLFVCPDGDCESKKCFDECSDNVRVHGIWEGKTLEDPIEPEVKPKSDGYRILPCPRGDPNCSMLP